MGNSHESFRKTGSRDLLKHHVTSSIFELSCVSCVSCAFLSFEPLENTTVLNPFELDFLP